MAAESIPMIHTNRDSYLELTEEAVGAIRAIIDASPYEDSVIFFYTTLDDLTALGLPGGPLTEGQLDSVESFASPADFLSKSRLHVEAGPRSSFPDDTIVEIAGIPINAPRSTDSSEAFIRMTYLEGEFRFISWSD